MLAPEEYSKVVIDEKIKKPLALMEDGKGGVLVRGLEEEIVTSANQIYTLLDRGSAKRQTAETLLNKQSRYAVFYIYCNHGQNLFIEAFRTERSCERIRI